MNIKLINWPSSNSPVWIVSESKYGYNPIRELKTTDINSELAKEELIKEINNQKNPLDLSALSDNI